MNTHRVLEKVEAANFNADRDTALVFEANMGPQATNVLNQFITHQG